MNRLAAALLLAGLLTASGCSQATMSRDALLSIPVPTQVTVGVRTIAGLGAVLTDDQGRTVYMFPPDAGSRVSCTGPCAGTWRPFVVAPGHAPAAGPGVQRADLSTLHDPNTGARIVTYNGFPLYRYAGDVSPGTANGQDLFLNAGPWYAVDPGGQPITSTPNAQP